jgi:hypothetical protein
VHATIANSTVDRRRARSATLLLLFPLYLALTLTLDVGLPRFEFLDRGLRQRVDR